MLYRKREVFEKFETFLRTYLHIHIFSLLFRTLLIFIKFIFLAEKCQAFCELIIKNGKVRFRNIMINKTLFNFKSRFYYIFIFCWFKT